MTKKKYKQLNQFERDRIEALLQSGHKQKEIAAILNRSEGTISREIKRNRLKRNGPKNKKGTYKANQANQKATNRKQFAKYQGKKITEDEALQKYIIKGLKGYQNPDEISGRMKKEKQPFYASKTAIYEWIYSVWGQRYGQYLPSQKHKKRKRKSVKTKKSLIPNRIGIEERPEYVNSRSRYGHREGDTIVSGKKTGSKEALVVVQERKAKYVKIGKIKSLKPKLFNQKIKKTANDAKINSLTLDNGIENRFHEQLGIPVYFCDSYSSWQKGGVENINKMIRRFIPKGSDISLYSEKYVKMVEDILNNKPRKSLGYKTPLEVMRENNLIADENKKTEMQKIALRG